MKVSQRSSGEKKTKGRTKEQVRRDGWRASQRLIHCRSFNICLLAPKTREAAATHLLIRAVINHSSHCVRVCVFVCLCVCLCVCVGSGWMCAVGTVIGFFHSRGYSQQCQTLNGSKKLLVWCKCFSTTLRRHIKLP